MLLILFQCPGGEVALPDRNLVMVDRHDGGALVVNPPREVWERSELTAEELTLWSFLVAATGKAMLDVLAQLEGGCINYWEAGNWALHDDAEPKGPKRAIEHRKVHQHLLGRSRQAQNPSWRWGEAPRFPDFNQRHRWSAENERLTPEECRAIVHRLEEILRSDYAMPAMQPEAGTVCESCGYPRPGNRDSLRCEECPALK